MPRQSISCRCTVCGHRFRARNGTMDLAVRGHLVRCPACDRYAAAGDSQFGTPSSWAHASPAICDPGSVVIDRHGCGLRATVTGPL